MTKVQIRFPLDTPLSESQFAQISDLHKIYGILRVIPGKTQDKLAVEYDASRVTVKEVRAALRRAGLPVRLEQ